MKAVRIEVLDELFAQFAEQGCGGQEAELGQEVVLEAFRQGDCSFDEFALGVLVIRGAVVGKIGVLVLPGIRRLLGFVFRVSV